MAKLVALVCGLLTAGAVFGQTPDHKVVVQVNSGGSATYLMVLGNVENLRKAFAPQHVSVEVVCLGPGLDLLFANNNPLAARIKKLEATGVVFAACANSMKGRHVNISRLLPKTIVVDSGVAEVVRKQEQGWSYLKGG